MTFLENVVEIIQRWSKEAVVVIQFEAEPGSWNRVEKQFNEV